VTRSAADVELVMGLLDQGLSQAEAARRSGIPRPTLRYWIQKGLEPTLDSRCQRSHHLGVGPAGHLPCEHAVRVPEEAYAYLLGLYLGDGCLSRTKKDVYRLRIALDLRYPGIIAECRAAMAAVLPNKVGVTNCPGCVQVNSYSKHWVCLFPQHAPGPKHLRPIILDPWQERIAVEGHPRLFLRGLIHSDGYRGMNRITAGYVYPRYLFSNRSDEIRGLFVQACAAVGIVARPMGRWQVSVARRPDVAHLDTFIGPKT
jgi:hypothetical protein